MPIYPSVITGTVAHKHESSSATGGPLDVNSITLATGLTEGGIIQGDNSTALTNLNIGAAGERLQVNAGATALEYVAAGGGASCGDILTISGQSNTLCKWLELGA
jgi:hypothetical protein